MLFGKHSAIPCTLPWWALRPCTIKFIDVYRIDVQPEFETHFLRMKSSEKVVADCSGKVCLRVLSGMQCLACAAFCIYSACWSSCHHFAICIGHQEESFNSLIIAAAPDGGLGLWHSIASTTRSWLSLLSLMDSPTIFPCKHLLAREQRLPLMSKQSVCVWVCGCPNGSSPNCER